MNTIRKDSTNYNPNKDPFNWTNEHFKSDDELAREEETQQAIVKGWQDVWNSGDEAKIQEMELARRISAAAEEDTLESRVQQVIKEVKANAIIEQKLQDLQHSGQTPEDFMEEQDSFGRTYRKIRKQAFEEVGL